MYKPPGHPPPLPDLAIWYTQLFYVGSCVWLGWVLFHLPRPMQTAWADAILLLAVLVLVPLVFYVLSHPRLAWDGPHCQWNLVACSLDRLAVIFVIFSFLLPTGWMAGILCLPWLILAGLLALAALLYVMQARGQIAPHHWPVLAACVYFPIGAGWLVLSRAGIRPLQFSDDIVLLTAIHFHFAGLVAPLIAALVLQAGPDRLSKLAAWGICLGVPLVAIGITASQLGFSPAWEFLTAAWLSAAGLLLASEQFRIAQNPDSGPKLTRWLWRISSASLALGMVLSIAYRVQFLVGSEQLSIPWMRATHGTLNAFGFALCGLIAWWWKFRTTEQTD